MVAPAAGPKYPHIEHAHLSPSRISFATIQLYRKPPLCGQKRTGTKKYPIASYWLISLFVHFFLDLTLLSVSAWVWWYSCLLFLLLLTALSGVLGVLILRLGSR
jgi:hypothetical protein